MQRLLVLMRHAKSDWGSGALSDFDRPLNARGERDAPRMARCLRAQQLVPQQVISSPAVRARETANRVIRELGLNSAVIEWDQRVYEAEVEDLLQVLIDHDKPVPVTLLVGHNPGLEGLARYLAGGETLPAEQKLLPTGGIIVIELPEKPEARSRGSGRCVAHMRPRWLQD
jgi:phosphohistidine phosphatase